MVTPSIRIVCWWSRLIRDENAFRILSFRGKIRLDPHPDIGLRRASPPLSHGSFPRSAGRRLGEERNKLSPGAVTHCVRDNETNPVKKSKDWA